MTTFGRDFMCVFLIKLKEDDSLARHFVIRCGQSENEFT